MKNIFRKSAPGFTMIEIVVVIFIVSVGILGVMSLIVQNVKSQTYNKNSLVAEQLSQEGIELVRMVRDTNWLTHVQFNTNLGGTGSAVGTSQSYFMDYTDTAPRLYSGHPTELELKIDSNGFYHDYDYSLGTPTSFYREITVSRPTDHSLKVVCTVTWTEKGQQRSYTLETMLYDWK